MNNQERVALLLSALGIDSASFLQFIEWALNQQLVSVLVSEIASEDFFSAKNSLKEFRKILDNKTDRNWSVHDLNQLFNVVRLAKQKHYREKIQYGDYLRLLWNTPHECAKCKKSPPDVKLHIDHIRPVSLGGSSSVANLQFLCAFCNLQKSNKLEGAQPWLDLS